MSAATERSVGLCYSSSLVAPLKAPSWMSLTQQRCAEVVDPKLRTTWYLLCLASAMAPFALKTGRLAQLDYPSYANIQIVKLLMKPRSNNALDPGPHFFKIAC
jgi:hypothetical protein